MGSGSSAIFKGMKIVAAMAVFLGLYASSLYNYLLFHSLSEIFSIVVACGIFMVAWNSRRFLENSYMLFLGVAYLFIGGVDLAHTLAYKGMGVFQGYGPNLATQLWIVARYMESISFLIAPYFVNKEIKIVPVVVAYSAATLLLFMAIFMFGIFPDCFVEGQGLTLFKKVSEYIIAFILIGSIVILYQRRDEFDPNVLRLLVASIIITVCSELAFTFYVSVYGLSNLIGHLLKIVSFYLIYKAIIETGLVRPYDLLFRKLKKSEEKLTVERNHLRKALEELKILKGILPICASCKKIRDDKGDWTQLEVYVKEHSEADFSHSVCPECAKKYYPDLKIYED